MTNLQTRILSAIILAAVALAATWLGGFLFRLLAVLIAAAMFYELAAMAGILRRPKRIGPPAACLAVVLTALLFGASPATIGGLIALAALATAVSDWRSRETWWGLVGLLYASLSAFGVAFLRDADEAGLSAVVFLFAVVWATDILAYFVGRALGGPKLWPAISPGKTWSGAVGGLVGAAVAGALVAYLLGRPVGAGLLALMVLLSVVSQAGDLFESWIKRRLGAKDSGSIVPGHGGIMDRVDGLVAAALTLYLVGLAAPGDASPAAALFGG